MTMESPGGRSLSDFTVELDVYSGPYEWLLALILKDELEIFEVPLRELVALYMRSRSPDSPNTLERDTDFAGSAAALILLKRATTRWSSPLRSSPSGSRSTSRSVAAPTLYATGSYPTPATTPPPIPCRPAPVASR